MTPQRVLFLAEGQLGDLLLLSPAVRALKETYRSASVSLLILKRRQHPSESPSLISTRNDSVYARNPHVESVFVLNRQGLRSLKGFRRVKAELEVVRFLRRQKPDIVICTFPQDRFLIWAFASGAGVRVSHQRDTLGWLVTHAVEKRATERGVLEHYCDLVRAVGGEITSYRTEYFVSAESKKWANDILRSNGLHECRRLVAIHPGASSDYRIWPPDRFAKLAEELDSTEGTRVILCHANPDTPIIDAIRTSLRRNIVVVQTGDDPDQLAALLQRCSLCISNSSGPRHLAAAVGTPTLALFRKHNDDEWKIYPESDGAAILQSTTRCPVCPEGTCLDKVPAGERFGSECMRMIDVESAIERALHCLSRSGVRSAE